MPFIYRMHRRPSCAPEVDRKQMQIQTTEADAYADGDDGADENVYMKPDADGDDENVNMKPDADDADDDDDDDMKPDADDDGAGTDANVVADTLASDMHELVDLDTEFDAVAKMDQQIANKRVSIDTVDFMVSRMKADSPSIGVVNPPSQPGEGKPKKVKMRAGKVVQRARLAHTLREYGIHVQK